MWTREGIGCGHYCAGVWTQEGIGCDHYCAGDEDCRTGSIEDDGKTS